MSVNGISALERGANQTPQRRTLELLVKALDLNVEQARVLEEAATRPSRPRYGAHGPDAEDFPHPLTPFFGRAESLAAVMQLIDERSLVTLTGPGGIGKTRLALKAAEESVNCFHDGVAFVDLAPLRAEESVLLALSAHFGVKGSGSESLLDRLVGALRSKEALLVVDNCEHLVPAVASAAAALIRGCPKVRIIATSRQPLNVPGEQLFRVPPLDVDAAVELFTDHATRAVGPDVISSADVDAIARIVTRLDGIALAIELASSRMKMLTLADLEQHLSERLQILSAGSAMTLPRHHTMRATLDWSYDLLGSREREVFGRLWIFQGGFSLDAAVAVYDDERTGKWQIFETLASLVDKSLVNSAREEAVQRYRLLETTRAYAAERMTDPADIASLRRRHAAYYASLAQRAAAQFEDADSTIAWARSLEPDLENFRSALDWQLQSRDDVASGVQMLSDLQELWIVQGIAAEAARRALDVLTLAADLRSEVQAALWLTIARMRQELFEHPGLTLEAAGSARELYERTGDRRGLALAIRQQAAAHMRLGAHAQARAEFERSLEIYRDLGDLRMVERGLGYLASLLQVQGQYVEARAMLLDVLESARSTGDDRMIPTISMNLAETEFALGECAIAAERARENLSNSVLRKNCDMLATQEANLSVYLLACGHLQDARAMAIASMGDAAGSFIAVPLQHLAASIAVDEPAIAATILGYVEETFRRTAFSREHTERFSFDYLTRALRCELEDGRSEAYRRDGASMNEKQILDLARSLQSRMVR